MRHTVQLYLGKRALLTMFRPRPFLKHLKQQSKRVKQEVAEPVTDERRPGHARRQGSGEGGDQGNARSRP